jgi:hypothetical protein
MLAMPSSHRFPDPGDNLPAVGGQFLERTTHNYSEAQLTHMHAVLLDAAGNLKIRIKKSDVMRAALDFILQDYDLNKENSWLVLRLQALKALALEGSTELPVEMPV